MIDESIYEVKKAKPVHSQSQNERPIKQAKPSLLNQGQPLIQRQKSPPVNQGYNQQ